jgi:hypothetical protein
LADGLFSDPQLDGSIRVALQRAIKVFDCDSASLERFATQSQTPWDIHIRKLTPELPMMLSDWVAVSLCPKFRLEYVVGVLDSKQQAHLRERFRAVARRTTGLSDVELPDTWL